MKTGDFESLVLSIFDVGDINECSSGLNFMLWNSEKLVGRLKLRG